MGRSKILSALLSVALCFSVLPATAFAGGGPEDSDDDVLEYWSQSSTPQQTEQQTPQQTEQQTSQEKPQQGEPLSADSEFSTRDLLYDKDTHKQFITVEGRGGNIFYLVIDYDAPVNEDEEQYKTYFLNQVDEADLAALLEEGEPAACSCTQKCVVGAVNTACPLCAVNMAECVGEEPEPVEPEEPEEPTEPDPEPVQKSGAGGLLAVALVVVLLAGGAVYFLKFKKKKPDTKGGIDLDDYDYGDEDEDEDYESGDAGDDPNDGEEQ